MMDAGRIGSVSGKRADRLAVLWYVCAFLAVMSVVLVNGRPLFYFDTIGYVDQGSEALRQLHIVAPEQTSSAATLSGGTESAVKTVDGSRSPFYSLIAGIFSHLGMLEGLLLFNATALFLAVWLITRVALRTHVASMSMAAATCLPLIIASLGSLPFYAAYLMPDLLAPVLVLIISALTAFGRNMLRWELLLAVLIGIAAIVSHLSHFAIAGLMLLAALPMTLFLGRRGALLAPLMIVFILGAAYLQGKAFQVVAEKAAHSEVVIKPYLTARLIQDGPGYQWLKRHCPDPEIDSCPLWDALQLSHDPYRLTASHITFETSKRLGSFRLMTEENQKRVADAQVKFFKAVLMEMPIETTIAFLKNTFIQSSMVSIDMTLPTDKIEMRNEGVTGLLSGPLKIGRLHGDRPWVEVLVSAETGFYVAALGFVITLLVLPGPVPAAVRVFAVMVMLGVLANALVCGGISQPATRYGARMIWLLPFLAAFLLIWAREPEPEATT
ncbi:MAG: hypothetical protein WAT77_06795 [Paracoccaceae bacterium]